MGPCKIGIDAQGFVKMRNSLLVLALAHESSSKVIMGPVFVKRFLHTISPEINVVIPNPVPATRIQS